VLRGEGTFLGLVPAHPWLWSDFDEFSKHQRRYSAATLRRLFEEANLSTERIFSINSVLFAPIVALRTARNAIKKIRILLGLRVDHRPRATGLQLPPSFINWILTQTFGMEARLAPRFDIPFGVTLVCIAQKR